MLLPKTIQKKREDARKEDAGTMLHRCIETIENDRKEISHSKGVLASGSSKKPSSAERSLAFSLKCLTGFVASMFECG